MNYKKIGVLVLIFALAFFASKYFQNLYYKDSLPVKEPISNLQFDTLEHDFKNLKQDIEASVYFVYENKSENPLKIKNISSRCGCTIPEWSRKELMPNEKDSILVKYDSKELGYFSKGIYIVSNSETSPDVLYIKGEVLE